MLQSGEWPEPKANLHIPVLLDEATGTHRFQYTSDGMLHVAFELPEGETAPEYVKRAALLPGEVALNKENRQMLRYLIDQVEALEAQAS